jgi:glycerol-3-phosphate dehydrogenase (NAD(P)+)
MRIAFIGAGSYGTAVAHHLARTREQEILIYSRKPETVNELNVYHTNERYLGQHMLTTYLKATNDLGEAVLDTDLLMIAVPAQSVRGVIKQIRSLIPARAIIVNLAKGIEVETLKRMSEVISESLQGVLPKCQVMTLSGPSFAADVVDPDKSVALTLGGGKRSDLKRIRDVLHSQSFRVFACRDLVGVELGGALKNVFALMAGVMKGAGEGNSYLGEFIPRALVEIDTIKRYFGARRDTSRAVSSLGDLIITCSDASRNFRFGRAYAQCHQEARPGDDVVDMAFNAIGNKTVEGYHTLKPIHRFVSEKNMFAPIVRELYDILYDAENTGKSPKDAIASFRLADSVRTWENLRTYSRLLSAVFPRLWYRRYYARGLLKKKND